MKAVNHFLLNGSSSFAKVELSSHFLNDFQQSDQRDAKSDQATCDQHLHTLRAPLLAVSARVEQATSTFEALFVRQVDALTVGSTTRIIETSVQNLNNDFFKFIYLMRFLSGHLPYLQM